MATIANQIRIAAKEICAKNHFPENVMDKMIHAMKHSYVMALEDYGIWKDGAQYIGCMNYRVKDIAKKVLEE